jgi:predicted enzyme related to lactoylglutathione lyase
MIKAQKIEKLILNVQDLTEAESFYASLLGITFERHAQHVLDDGVQVRGAISSFGLELVEQTKPRTWTEGVRGFSIVVPDIEEVKTEMKRRNIPLVVDFDLPDMKESIYHFRNMRVVFIQYKQKS